MNKSKLRETMLSLTQQEFQQAKSKYEVFLRASKIDRLDVVGTDELAQADAAAELAEAFDDKIHTHAEKLKMLEKIDFGSKSLVEPGAAVSLGGRWLVVAVSTSEFECEGAPFIGISQQSPIYTALEGKSEGETCEFNGSSFVVGEIF